MRLTVRSGLVRNIITRIRAVGNMSVWVVILGGVYQFCHLVVGMVFWGFGF